MLIMSKESIKSLMEVVSMQHFNMEITQEPLCRNYNEEGEIKIELLFQSLGAP